MKNNTRRLLSGAISAVFTASLMVAPSMGTAAAAGDITPDSQTLVYITSGYWDDIVLCANPDDDNVWIGRLEEEDPYCQWEQIGDDSRFAFFNPAKGMVLTGVAGNRPLAMAELAFPATNAQNFAWGPQQEWGGRALQWNGNQKQNVDVGDDAIPSDDPARLRTWRDQGQQTWNVRSVGTPAVPQKARSASAVFVTNNRWTDEILCAAIDGRVHLSTNKFDPACEWLPFGPRLGPFVLYNPQYGKVITYNGGPLVMGDLTYPSDAHELWAFGPEQYAGADVLRWAEDITQGVDAGTTVPTTRPVSLRDWNSGHQQSMTWTFQTTGRPTATVTLGDSFMSGEAGRWKGNSDSTSGSRDGTDRAYKGWERYDRRMVYGSSADNHCNRSDSAESHSSNSNEVQVNLACSGAETKNIFRAVNGGEPFKGEAPQADQLAEVARRYDVRLIALSIGGNDLGFGGIIEACVKAYLFSKQPCHDEQQKIVVSKLATTQKNVVKAITEIQQTMEDAGYDPGHYKIVMQSAPSPTPMSGEMRYPEGWGERSLVGGCPFWNADADWARGRLTREISRLLKSAAEAAGVGFLDLQDALNGREVCSRTSQLVTSKIPPSESSSEWARFLVTGWGQGELQESFHPNYYGQRALGRCLALYDQLEFGEATCANTPGAGPERMVLTEIS